MRGSFSVFLQGMSRKLRFVPEGGALVEVTCRTIHGRVLLRPSQQLDEIVVGILARAQRTFQVRCCGYCFLGNHYHLLLDVDSAQQLEAAWRQRAAALVAEIEGEFATQRAKTGNQTLGVPAVLAQNPHDRPQRSKKSPAPFVHAASHQVRREIYEAYRWFVAAYRSAAEKLRAGDPTARFPAGSFPPALPFVAV